MLGDVCMWIGKILGGLSEHNLMNRDSTLQVCLSTGLLWSWVRAWIVPAGKDCGEYLFVKVCRFFRMKKWFRHLYKSWNVVCRHHGTILTPWDPRFRSSGFGNNLPYSFTPGMFELGFSLYKLKISLYPKCISKDWWKKRKKPTDLGCTFPWIRYLTYAFLIG